MLAVVIVYAALFMEWDERGSPFDEVGALSDDAVGLSIRGYFLTRGSLLASKGFLCRCQGGIFYPSTSRTGQEVG